MAAWYYQMGDVLRSANVAVEPPSDEQRRTYLAQVVLHYPEVAPVAETISTPRPFVPPPAIAAPAAVVENEGVVIAPPPEDHQEAPAMIPTEPGPAPAAAQQSPPSGAPQSEHPPPPPPMVDPSKVKYD